MATKIFKDYSEFLQREDKAENGVSQIFADNNPNWEAQNATNKGCWNCSGCSGCSGCFDCSDCSDCFDCSGCSGCFGCSGCSDCSGCFDCSDCFGCFDCSDCFGCSDCSDKKGESKPAGIPVIENIHQKVLDAVKMPNALDMSTWHTCDTTHCRAGWVVTLAGEDGKALEEETSTEFAALQIYRKSSNIRVSPVRFYEGNETAMEDIKRCAEEEAKQSKQES